MFNKKPGDPKLSEGNLREFPDEYAALEAEYILPERPESAKAAATAPVPAEDDAPAQEPPAEPAPIAEAAETQAPAPEAEAEPETEAVTEPEAEAVTEPETEPEQEPAQVEAPEPKKPAEPEKTAQTEKPAEPEKPTEPEISPSEDAEEEKAERSHKHKKKDNELLKKQQRKKLKKENRRKTRFITPLIMLGVVLLIVGLCLFNILYCDSNFEVNFYHVESTHVSSDIRLVVLSDVHLKEYGEGNSKLLDAVSALHPDLIISAGDMVTYGEDDYESMLTLCEGLADIAPFYGVMGNHEDEKVYLEGDDELRDRFADTGMIPLINKCERLRVKNNEIEIVGVSGDKDGFDNYGGARAMESLDRSRTALRICVAHVPTLFDERLDEYKFDIGIAGHTHGGVVRLPVVGGLYSAEEGFLPDYDGGMYTLDNGAELFVSRGLGNSGSIPRFNNTPELGVIDVRWY